LPEGVDFSDSTCFFTFGYDVGVAFLCNCHINLASTVFREHMDEIKYFTIHELHHAGYIMQSGMPMQTLSDYKTHDDMVKLIERTCHLEGMGTYAPFGIREKEGALGGVLDCLGDYTALLDPRVMDELVSEFFETYNYFKETSDKEIDENDWKKYFFLTGSTGGKRHFYKVGAFMAMAIDRHFGREYLNGLISKPPAQFIYSWITLKQ
jgi:hypothetical protein